MPFTLLLRLKIFMNLLVWNNWKSSNSIEFKEYNPQI